MRDLLDGVNVAPIGKDALCACIEFVLYDLRDMLTNAIFHVQDRVSIGLYYEHVRLGTKSLKKYDL